MSSHPGPTLEINLNAIAHNYALLDKQLKSGRCGAVVKANAYGLGAVRVSPILFNAGCRDFFVATLSEAIELRGVLPEATIYVFHGVRTSQVKEFSAHRLIPVLNDKAQIDAWGNAGPCALHIDTGMCRLGLSARDAEELATLPAQLQLVMSHLACASDCAHPKNKEQLELFRTLIPRFPGIPLSFINSSGIFLGPDYHFDLARPGRALYGIARNAAPSAVLENVVTLSAPVLQYRTLDRAQSVGYGATVEAQKGAVLATVEMGYADGFKRLLSNKAYGYVGDIRVKVLGIVSMDMIIVDVSTVPEHLRTADMRVTFIGKEQSVGVLAEAAETIGYEIFTGLGARVRRVYY